MENFAEMREQAQIAGLSEMSRDHESRIKELEKTGKLIVDIHTALLGTLEKPGLVKKINDHDEYISEQRGWKKRVWWTVEKFAIAAGLTWALKSKVDP